MERGMVCVPHTGYFQWRFVPAFFEMMYNTPGLVLNTRWVGSSLVYTAREEAAEEVLKQGYDWLFFLDSDMVPPPDIITRLLAHNKPIVSAMAFKRDVPHTPCFYKDIQFDGEKAELDIPKTWSGGLEEVAGVGSACILIRREVFEKTPRPWYFPLPVLAEDLAFCKRAKEAGFPIYVDTGITCGHIAQTVVTDEHYTTYLRRG